MDYPTPLPDFSRLALAGSFQLAGRTCTLQISTVQRFVDYGPHFDVLHLQVLLDGQPLALADLNARLPAVRCYQLWSDLCAALQETTIAAYGLEPDPSGEPNPRLGCWGPRPDLAIGVESDCHTALVVGLAVDTRLASRHPAIAVLAPQLAAALLRALREWEATALLD
jgi:hypothetical protein